MTNFKRRTILTAAAISLLMLAALLRFGKPHVAHVIAGSTGLSSDEVPRGDLRRHARSSAAGLATHEAWAVGTRRTYSAQFATNLDFPEQAQKAGLTMSGRAAIDLVSVEDGDRTLLKGVLHDTKVIGTKSVGSDTLLPPELPAQLARPFAIALDRDRRIQLLYMERDLDPVAQSILRYLVSSLQFVWPADVPAEASSWSAQEADPNGVCTAAYAHTADGSFSKQKRDYRDSPVEQSGTNVPRPVITAGGTYRVDSALRVIERANLEESVQTRIAGTAMTSQSQSELELTHTDRSEHAELDRAWLDRLLAIPLNGLVTAPPAPPKPLAVNVTYEGVLSEFAKTKQGDLDLWVEKLAQLIKERPGHAAAILRTLHEGKDLSSDERTQLVAALGEAGTPEAQAALLALSKDSSIDANLRQTAVVRLGFLKEPTAETLDGLRELASNPAHAEDGLSALMLGAATREARDSGDQSVLDKAQQGADFLQRALSQTKDPGTQALYLSALGNAATPANLDIAARALDSSSPDVRGAAVSSLRLLPGAQAEGLIVNAVQNDPDPVVRMSSVDVLRYRDMTDTVRATLSEVLRKDDSTMVRNQALNVLSPYSSDDAVRTQLDWTANNDPSEELRKHAREMLARNRKEG